MDWGVASVDIEVHMAVQITRWGAQSCSHMLPLQSQGPLADMQNGFYNPGGILNTGRIVLRKPGTDEYELFEYSSVSHMYSGETQHHVQQIAALRVHRRGEGGRGLMRRCCTAMPVRGTHVACLCSAYDRLLASPSATAPRPSSLPASSRPTRYARSQLQEGSTDITK